MALVLNHLLDSNSDVMRLTITQYHRMMEAGIVQEGAPYELINGIIVRKDRSARGADPMTVGHEHAWVITKLTALNAKLAHLGGHIRIQLPISLPPDGEPEPDGLIARGNPDKYLKKHPRAVEATCLIEVADSSLNYDRTTKAALYANANIPQYVIINLPDRVLEVYSEPQVGRGHFGRVETLRPGSKVQLAVGNRKLEVLVRSLLP